MRFSRLTLGFALATGLGLSVAAGLAVASGRSRAAIQHLSMPEVAGRLGDGTVSLEGLVSVDADEQPHKVRVRLPALGQVADFPITLDARRGTFPLAVQLAAGVPSGALEYELSLVDRAGQESEPVRRTVQIPAP